MSNLKQVIDDEEFNALMSSVGDDLAVLDFHTSWCGPCKQMEPFIQSLSMKYPRILFLKVQLSVLFQFKIEIFQYCEETTLSRTILIVRWTQISALKLQ
jgi:thiol-disulfide isomerase/thioredoxin